MRRNVSWINFITNDHKHWLNEWNETERFIYILHTVSQLSYMKRVQYMSIYIHPHLWLDDFLFLLSNHTSFHTTAARCNIKKCILTSTKQSNSKLPRCLCALPVSTWLSSFGLLCVNICFSLSLFVLFNLLSCSFASVWLSLHHYSDQYISVCAAMIWQHAATFPSLSCSACQSEHQSLLTAETFCLIN